MKAVKILVIFLVMVLIFSCEDEYNISFVDCNYCTAEEPLQAYVKIMLRDPLESATTSGIIFVEIFEGNYEDKVLFTSIQTTSNETSIDLPVNKKYTFAASYLIDNKTYIVINSITTRVRFSENACDEPCYYTSPRKVNLRLKYTE